MPAPVVDAEPARETPARSPRTVLIVDDEPIIIMAAVMMLNQTGYRVLEAHSGMCALAQIRSEEPIDLLVTDFSMPGMDGGQLAQASRELRPSLPILITTGYTKVPIDIGIAFHTLRKPYLLDQLLRAVDKIIGKPMD